MSTKNKNDSKESKAKKELIKEIKDIDEFEWLNKHNLAEIVNTTNLFILPSFNFIPENDLKTTFDIIIKDLPKSKHIESKDGSINAIIPYAIVEFETIEYSLQAGSIALQRSFICKAIELTQKKLGKRITEKEIDLSIILDKTVKIKREKFTTKGFTQAPYKIY